MGIKNKIFDVNLINRENIVAAYSIIKINSMKNHYSRSKRINIEKLMHRKMKLMKYSFENKYVCHLNREKKTKFIPK